MLTLALCTLLLTAGTAMAGSAVVSGTPTVGSTLTVSVKGGSAAKARWQACPTAPKGQRCAKPTSAGKGATHVVAASESGKYLRAVVAGKGRGISSKWVGPITAAAGGSAGVATGLAGAPTGGLTGQTAIDRFHQLMTGSKMYRIKMTTVIGSSAYTTWDIRWCSDGSTFSWVSENIGDYSSSHSEARGTYQVTQAGFNADNTLAEGLVAYQASPPDTALGPSGQVIIRLGSGVAWIDSLDAQYDWLTGQAGC